MILDEEEAAPEAAAPEEAAEAPAKKRKPKAAKEEAVAAAEDTEGTTARESLPQRVSRTEHEAWHMQRLDATPGVTGLWQLKGRGLVTIDEMARLDIEYIACQSLWFDVKIMFLTIPAMLSGRGAA